MAFEDSTLESMDLAPEGVACLRVAVEHEDLHDCCVGRLVYSESGDGRGLYEMKDTSTMRSTKKIFHH